MWDLSEYFPKLVDYLRYNNIDTTVDRNSKCPLKSHKSATPFRVGIGSGGDPVWTCFACSEGGTIFDLAASINGFPTMGEFGFYDVTLQHLSDVLNIDMPDRNQKQVSPEQQLKRKLYSATNDIKNSLKITDRVKEFSESRDWTIDTLSTFNVGEIVDFNKLYDMLYKKYPRNILKYIGMYPNSFLSEDRLIFPMADEIGRTIGFTGRLFVYNSEMKRKYVNTSNSPIFKKSELLYNLNRVRVRMKKNEVTTVYVVEGQADVLTMYQNGIQDVVAISGTSFTDKHMQSFENIPNIICCLDSDDGGMNATRKMYKKFATKSNKDLFLLQLPDGQDPDDFVRDNGPSALIEQEPMLPIEWEIRNTKSMAGLVAAEYWLTKIHTQSTLHHNRILDVLSQKSGVDTENLKSRLTQLNMDYILNNIPKIAVGDMGINITIQKERNE